MFPDLLTNFSPYKGPSFPYYTDGIIFGWIEGKDLLQANLMLPAIGQIILVHPPFFAAEVEVTESYLMGIVAETDATRLPDPIRLAPNEELV